MSILDKSRKMRQKFPSTPVKIKVKARPAKRKDSITSDSSLDFSDDDGYSAVDDVSDSEDDDEEDVDAAEEEHIISHGLHRIAPSAAPRPLTEPHQDEDDGAADEEDEAGDEVAIEDEEAQDDEDAAETGSWDGMLSEMDESAGSGPNHYILDQDVANVERHVRFTGVPDSDSDSTTTDTTIGVDEYFPDIFVSQTALDPAFRREIEEDPDESSGSTSFWDFHGNYEYSGAFVEDSDDDDRPRIRSISEEDTPIGTPLDSHIPTEMSTPAAAVEEPQELDGYETDGDTTEEDIPEPLIRRKQHHRIQAVVVDESDSDTDRRVRFRRGKPRVGRFNLDSSGTKPIAVMNPISRKMMIFTPQRLRRLDLSPESFNLQYFNGADTVQSSPIMSNSASLMMSAMFSSNTFGDFMNTQPVGPAEAFFSMTSDAVTGEESDDFDGTAEEEDEEERNLKLEDFITFHGHGSDEEADDENAADAAVADLNSDDEMDTVASTPGRRSSNPFSAAAADDAAVNMGLHPLLSHFGNNADAVGAFRRNQLNQQLIASDKATQDSLAFSGPYHHGTLRGIKDGSLQNVTTPITPMRRQKQRQHGGDVVFNSPSEKVSAKRKASGAVGGGLGAASHKKQRSISDVKALHL